MKKYKPPVKKKNIGNERTEGYRIQKIFPITQFFEKVFKTCKKIMFFNYEKLRRIALLIDLHSDKK